MIVTRFAPSPNGPLHLGHAFAALIAHDLARERGGRFLLRIEDIDGVRSRTELADAFRADLAWLGLEYEEVAPQSSRLASYGAAAERLKAQGLLYPCRCTRAQIAAAVAEKGTPSGPDGPIYPGTCRGRAVDPAGEVAWRLDMAKAVALAGPLEWTDELAGVQRATPEIFGDVVLLRKEAPASYHLAATLDDAADGVTLVTRGMDLFPASHVHRLLQALLGLPVPLWHHHQLLVDREGRKLAKRRGSGTGLLGLTELRLAGEDGRALAASLRDRVLPAGVFTSEGLDRGL
ncbi:tRNA glutamyl-Q(34) synthetase GluQRS [Altererythrobacter sp. CC-YST694]|uniref:tRNA glutamyl-Q(34) synthetase GluQRS n=1 Tax=Altererythrobacter sp. CC-YST694 TaxID=2755038 RepID=UPI001D019016|nr:tRNA glutamyl-Q(34) synthetase GluQRS [Altererythrobacter sp. CC-YST694]MCB5425620.1 tRNA glutamyl-Q(34) synthetase GluQRS [Altererythrobacter sp. CC-YST694]